MNTKKTLKQEIIESCPVVSNYDYIDDIKEGIKENNKITVILDDDPTGTQTVSNVTILTEWSFESIIEQFKKDQTAFFILTNTRSFSEEKATKINEEIAMTLKKASTKTGREYTIISRGDSTLRGHFPLELEVIENTSNIKYDGWIICPYFEEGKRYTAYDKHYIEENEEWIPVGETPFAKDTTFGFKSSDIKEYVEEKSNGDFKKEDIISISIEDIRVGGVDRVEEILLSLKDRQVCIVNSIQIQDVRCVALASIKAETKGKRLLYRTSASFVQARLGQSMNPLLKDEDVILNKTKNGGIVFVGSHVPRTTQQLNYLIKNSDIVPFEINVLNLLDEEKCAEEVEKISLGAEEVITKGKDVVIYTSRDIVRTDNHQKNLEMSVKISEGLVTIANRIQEAPRYIVSKGGITSSDIATKSLKTKKALVLGQILPAVPVWKLGEESKYPGMALIIFPGNVGVEDSLFKVVNKLKKSN